ncbi:MAG: DUF1592 domain-containing protein [Acidobacteriota bacterium]|nr:DUF1592 domain-containing protein [Acidobacteriota bacterium]
MDRSQASQSRSLIFGAVVVGGWLTAPPLWGQSFEAEMSALVDSSCIRCHDASTVTPIDFSRVEFDLQKRETFGTWEKVYERIRKGEMPPADAPQLDAAARNAALASLESALTRAHQASRGGQRAPLRRLTRLEYGYTLQDILGLDEAVATSLGELLPEEAATVTFDTVAVNQGVSPLHVRSYLDVATRALDAALMVGERPKPSTFEIDYSKSERLYRVSRAKALGQGMVKQLPDAYVMFFDFGSTYTFHSQTEGYRVQEPGRYRVTVDAYPYQAVSPVTLRVYRGRMAGVAAVFTELAGTFDLLGETPQAVQVTPYLQPGDLIALSVADLDFPETHNHEDYEPKVRSDGWGGMHDYPGEGIAVRFMTLEGPLTSDLWPPQPTWDLLAGMGLDDSGDPVLTKPPFDHVVDIVQAFAPKAFRRPVSQDEVHAYASLARPLLDEGQSFLDAVRVSLRAVLSAPSFLFHSAGTPDSDLDDFGFATRLSYFLWRSTPDAELFELARRGKLADGDVQRQQVERMLDDSKHERFISDFAGQAFRLNEILATTPDGTLYPEYDGWLGEAMVLETKLFVGELIGRNLGVGQLVDSDFTFVNRQLAEHYGIPGVAGQHMRKVKLPASSPRGGLLTQASVLKVTSNGTTTSPVPRGNFVLASVLGTPPQPPPAGVEGLEPDTRGAVTIREQLSAHRSEASCNSCHTVIDPPGFALESFDPIGGFRTRYRVSTANDSKNVGSLLDAPTLGPVVDPSGVTPQGQFFTGIEDYKRIMLERDLDQVARHLASQFLVFATGAEIGFADRKEVEKIVDLGRPEGHPMREMIHRVVRSELFRSR